MRNVRGRGIAEAADRRDLRTGGKVARPGEATLVDEALGDHVETRLRGGGAAASGEAGVDDELRHLHRDKHVLLDLHHVDGIDARRVVPGKMQMRVDHPRHQRGAHAVDDSRAAHGAGAETGAAARHLLDAIALDKNLARIGIFAGRIENAHIGEKDGFWLATIAIPARAVSVTVCHQNLPRIPPACTLCLRLPWIAG